MRLRTTAAVVLTLGLGLGLAGCGDDGESADASNTSNSAAPSAAATVQAALTQEQLDASLLTTADLPTGWTAGSWEPGDDSMPDFQPAACGEEFRTQVEGEEDPVRESGVAFTRGGANPVEVEMEVSVYAEPFDASELPEFDEFLKNCGEMTTTIEGTPVQVGLTALSFPPLGDASRALNLALTFEGGSVGGDQVMVAMGHNEVTFTTTGTNGAAVDAAEFEQIVRAGVTKVEAAGS